MRNKGTPNSIFLFTEAEELLRLQYRASLDRIMKMSIYDNKSSYDIQFMVNEFMFNSGNSCCAFGELCSGQE